MTLYPWTFDAETHYTDKAHGEYSLTWMTAEQYIRDPRFELIGFSMKPGNGQTRWFSGDLNYLRGVARQFDWSKMLVIGHNMSEFDSLILTEILGVRPAAYACTLQMARALHGGKQSNSLDALCQLYGLPAKGKQVQNYINFRRADFSPAQLADYGRYCDNDVDRCWDLYNILAPQMPAQELWLGSLCTRMFCEPRLVLDNQLLRVMRDDLVLRKAALLDRVGDIMGVDGNLPRDQRTPLIQGLLRKDAILADTFRNQYDIDPPMKPSPKKRDANGQPLMVYAFAKTDEGMEALLEYEDESDPQGADDIQALAAARLGVKSTQAETRANRFLGISERGALPVAAAYGKTHTHRLAGCLVAGTKITCYDPNCGVVVKRIVDVLPDDLVWDGDEFVAHDGVKFQGYAEVIEHDGVTGTNCHPVFTEGQDEPISLAEAARTGARIVACEEPTDWAVDCAERGTSRQARLYVPLSVRLRG